MKRIVSIALVFASFSTLSFAACTESDVQAKSAAFQGRIAELLQKDPERVREQAPEMQKRILELQNLSSLEPICTFYDEMLKKLQ